MPNLFIKFLLVVTWSFFFNASNAQFEITVLQTGKLGGSFVAEFLSSQGVTYYGERIQFKYNTDSFYYWHVRNGSGVGRYQIKGDTLILTFSNASPVAKEVKVNASTALDARVALVAINKWFDSAGQRKTLRGSTVEVSNKYEKLIYSKSIDEAKLQIPAAEFPITIRGYCLDFHSIKTVLADHRDFKIDLLFSPAKDYRLDHGEVSTYQISTINALGLDLLPLMYLGDDHFSPNGLKRFVFITYKSL
jgi:hypothetical protein